MGYWGTFRAGYGSLRNRLLPRGTLTAMTLSGLDRFRRSGRGDKPSYG